MSGDGSEFMRRFAPLVEPYLPVRDGETKAQYVARFSADYGKSPARDATIGRAAVKVEAEIARERQQKKDAWIATARRSFRPSWASPCQVCGKYKGLTHAHHLVPLALQFDRGFLAPDHDHVWLCPTHHAAIHALIGGADAEKSDDERNAIRGRRGLNGIVDMELHEIDVLLELLSMSGWGS